MRSLVVQQTGGLCGHVRVPGDKSISHRALLLGSIAQGVSRVEGFLASADCLATLHVLRDLGVEIEELTGLGDVGRLSGREDPAAAADSGTVLVVHGRGMWGLAEPADILDCARSGTTMRLLAGILAGQRFFSVLSGDAQLRRRPMGRIVEPLGRMGARIMARDGGRLPPLAIAPPEWRCGGLQGIDYILPVASAQVKSALLLAGLHADGPTTLHVPGPARDHTERMLLAMGGWLETHDWAPPGVVLGTPHHDSDRAAAGPHHPVAGEAATSALIEVGGGQCVRLEPGATLQAVDLCVPGDFSSAAFFLAAAAIVPGSEVVIEGTGINPTRTGFLDVLHAMGADVILQNERTVGGEPVADLVVRTSELRSVEVGGPLVVRAIDEFPILAVVASQAQGETVVRDAAELRVKETDRIATTVRELRRMGAEIESRADGFVVCGPTRLRSPEIVEGPGAAVHSHGDHRLAMALAVAGLVAEGETRIQAVDCIGDSYPGFEEALRATSADRP